MLDMFVFPEKGRWYQFFGGDRTVFFEIISDMTAFEHTLAKDFSFTNNHACWAYGHCESLSMLLARFNLLQTMWYIYHVRADFCHQRIFVGTPCMQPP